jgi:hypothetical protein
MQHALPLLERYRNHHLCFNDDVQVHAYGIMCFDKGPHVQQTLPCRHGKDIATCLFP